MAVWPEDRKSRNKLRKMIRRNEREHERIGECCIRELPKEYFCVARMAPTLEWRGKHSAKCYSSYAPKRGLLQEDLRRGIDGLWRAVKSIWRGNKGLLSWPPAVRDLPDEWEVTDCSRGSPIAQQIPNDHKPQHHRTRDSTEDVRYVNNARSAGYFPEALTSSYSMDEEAATFGKDNLGFPTTRRPNEYRREMKQGSSPGFAEWMGKYPMMIGSLADTPERKLEVMRLLETWKDIFCENIRDMPATDLVVHRIPTYPNAIPRVCKPPLYTTEEVKYQRELLPQLVDAKIIARCDSPWSARSRFPRKSSGALRMVHAFVGLNNVTIKSNYPQRRIEGILKGMANPKISFYFQADGANGYWAIKVWEAHCYKLAFSSSEGQFCYLRMGQGCTGGAGTYARLKDIMTSAIPNPNAEPSLDEAMTDAHYQHYLDDDLGGASSFEGLMDFLHNHYFPRLAWAKLTLNPKKCMFFSSKIQILGHQRDELGLRPSVDKLGMFREWPVPQTKEEIMRFCYMLPFLKHYIPGRADLTAIIKKAIVEEKVKVVRDGNRQPLKLSRKFVGGLSSRMPLRGSSERCLRMPVLEGRMRFSITFQLTPLKQE